MQPERKCYTDSYPGCYVVEVDGEIGYMSMNDVRPNPFSTGTPGGGDSGSGGGGGDVWTPPVL